MGWQFLSQLLSNYLLACSATKVVGYQRSDEEMKRAMRAPFCGDSPNSGGGFALSCE